MDNWDFFYIRLHTTKVLSKPDERYLKSEWFEKLNQKNNYPFKQPAIFMAGSFFI